MGNKTLEFAKVYKQLEHLCFSYPLLVHNKSKVIDKLMQLLQEQSLKVIQATIIDLCIALIKDLRSDIYEEFVRQLMPQVISLIEVSNVTLLDKIFTMISFGIKYLLKSVKDDIRNFYYTYYELLVNKSAHIRKFAAQSFSYVIRKLRFD